MQAWVFSYPAWHLELVAGELKAPSQTLQYKAGHNMPQLWSA